MLEQVQQDVQDALFHFLGLRRMRRGGSGVADWPGESPVGGHRFRFSGYGSNGRAAPRRDPQAP
ncbi:hypothetical protein [Lysobacter gummosus]|uniref:hypothetical protein n=1 Tax=Lysobacter gummosus TaxID=262324 RepID=UPI003642F234